MSDGGEELPVARYSPVRLRDGVTASALIISGRRGDRGLDTRLVEAKLKMGMLYPEDMPQLAWDALESGFNGRSLCVLTGLYKPTGRDTDPLLPGLKVELGLNEIDERTACLRLAQDFAREILNRKLDPISNLARFAHLWRDGGYPIELSGLGQLEDEICYSAAIIRQDFLEEVLVELNALAVLQFE